MPAFHTKTSGPSLTRVKGQHAAGRRQIEGIPAGANLQPSGSYLPDPTESAADPVSKYLDEISAISLLSADDEKALAKRIRKGIMARKKLEQNDGRGEDTEKLKKQGEWGRMAEGLLFKANLRLVAYLAGGYRNTGMSLSDLIQEGNIGLLRAIQSINDINSIRRWLETEKGREADCREIALEMGLLSAQDVKKIKKALASGKPLDAALKKRWNEAAGRVGALAGIGREAIPFGSSGDEEDGRCPEELLGDETNPDPFDVIFRQETKERLFEIMGSLGEQECRVLQMRFGLVDGCEMTVEEVADELGLTSDRVRQLETKAMRNLRHPAISSRLKDLLK